MKEIPTISSHISPASLLDMSGGNCQRAQVDESGMDRNCMGLTTDQKWSQCKGRQRHAPAVLYPREWTPSTHWIDWMGLSSGLDKEARGKIICSTGDRTPFV
jgi:hypothetical protein